MEEIRVIFVLPSGCHNKTGASADMLNAFELCQEHVSNKDSQVSWIKECDLISSDLSRTDFVIFQEFQGSAFEAIKDKNRILGPMALIVCLTEGKPIPKFSWPIWNVAMFDCMVTSSALKPEKKMELRERIQLMGGYYTDNLRAKNTHLVTESVKSKKYTQAAEAQLKIMVSKWVDDVWEESQSANVHCNDKQFEKNRCLPFHKLIICSTGFTDPNERENLSKLIVSNGGAFMGKLLMRQTDVLLVNGIGGTTSEKYKAASKSDAIKCVKIDWLHDSLKKGYALPCDLYHLTASTSTPTKEDQLNLNFSCVSAIAGPSILMQKTTLEETVTNNKSPFNLNSVLINKRQCSSTGNINYELIEDLDIKQAKRAGQFLDGFSVYLAGFEGNQREKLFKILNLSGATRYDDISERVTHIIVGDVNCPELKILKTKNFNNCVLVNLHWLLDSLNRKCPSNENDYLVSINDLDSINGQEFCKKGLNLLRSSKTVMECDLTFSPQNEQEDVDLLEQYRSSKLQETDTLENLLKNQEIGVKDPSLTITTENSDSSTDCFTGLKFLLLDFQGIVLDELEKQIEDNCGKVVLKSFKGIPDFIVCPIIIQRTISLTANEIVNNLFISDAIHGNSLPDVCYYHKPLLIEANRKPLENCVITITTYTHFERLFLKNLIEALGGVTQDQFARINSSQLSVFASTHLIGIEANGKKYLAALKWNIPVVNKNWLLECAKTGQRVLEDDYLVGEAKSPNRSKNINRKLSFSEELTNNICGSSSGDIPVRKFTSPSNLNSDNPESSEILNKKPEGLNISSVRTPRSNKMFENVRETPDVCSQVTPVNKIMQEFRKANRNSDNLNCSNSESPKIPKTWWNVETPEAPIGACIRPDPSPNLRKTILQYINQLPDYSAQKQRRLSTPLSEVKRQAWARLCSVEYNSVNDNAENLDLQNEEIVPTQNKLLNQLEEAVSASGGDINKRTSKNFQSILVPQIGVNNKETQPLSVGWDFSSKEAQTKIFLLSGENDQRQNIITKLESLGGIVSVLSNYDPNCTHLICPKAVRNEKTLSCIAAGKWILHISYVDECVKAGKFLNEDLFEFGNPKANLKYSFSNETEKLLNQSIYWWRHEISRRGYGAFNDMRAIVVAQKREPIIRVIEAGGGVVVDVRPPFDDTVHVTHCLLELKSISDFSPYTPLAQQGIYCVNTLYINNHLLRMDNCDIRNNILPYFSKYYNNDN